MAIPKTRAIRLLHITEGQVITEDLAIIPILAFTEVMGHSTEDLASMVDLAIIRILAFMEVMDRSTGDLVLLAMAPEVIEDLVLLVMVPEVIGDPVLLAVAPEDHGEIMGIMAERHVIIDSVSL